MYIVYENMLYYSINKKDYYKIVTRNNKKKDKDFYSNGEVYVKKISTKDLKIQEIYDVDFYVVYHDTSKTMEMALQKIKKELEEGCYVSDRTLDEVFHHKWEVNDGGPVYPAPRIEDNEVALIWDRGSYSEDWVMEEKCVYSKRVNIYDCEKLLVKYTYSVRNGKPLTEEEVVEVTMEPEDFKAEMLKYRLENI